MVLTRTAYLDRLRRAFLLRVHPDRFRNHSAQQRQKQAQLVTALTNRFSQSDFQLWQKSSGTNHAFYNSLGEDDSKEYSFALEHRDGSLFRTKFYLNKTVPEILADMTWALEKCGAGAHIPSSKFLDTEMSGTHDSNNPSPSTNQNMDPSMHSSNTTSLSFGPASKDFNRYNIKSNQGRSLFHFVQHDMDHEEVTNRKMARTEAQSAALAVRRLYKFQAVDATSLGWSSGSVAVLLNRLVALHEEHNLQFKVDSFYPLRLVFSPFDEVEERRYGGLSNTGDEISNQSSSRNFSALDLHGGTLKLHPASTPLQWLDHVREVTPERLELVKQIRQELELYKGLLKSRHNLSLVKGFSCSSEDYFHALRQLCLMGDDRTVSTNSNTSYELVTEPLVVKVESSLACHRREPTVTKEGSIRLSREMCQSDCLLDSIAHLAVKARQKRAEYEEEKRNCLKVAKDIQWQLGLPRQVFKYGVIQQNDFLESLCRMKELIGAVEEKEREQLKLALGGSAMGITGSGHFCHLSDDGSLIVPHDWL